MSAIVTGDLRGAAKEQRRAKNHRMKYKNTNMAMIGTNISILSPNAMIRNSNVWNDKNKFRMRARNWDSCHCHICRRFNERNQTHTSAFEMVACTAGFSRKVRPSLRADDIDNIRDLEEDDQSDYGYDDGVDGVVYSYDNAGPTRRLDLSYAVTAAVEKFETKELETLIKNEYDIVQESETDEEFEIIDL